MKKYEATINLTLLLTAKSEDEARESINGEFINRLLDITANKDSRFDFLFELLQIEEN